MIKTARHPRRRFNDLSARGAIIRSTTLITLALAAAYLACGVPA